MKCQPPPFWWCEMSASSFLRMWDVSLFLSQNVSVFLVLSQTVGCQPLLFSEDILSACSFLRMWDVSLLLSQSVRKQPLRFSGCEMSLPFSECKVLISHFGWQRVECWQSCAPQMNISHFLCQRVGCQLVSHNLLQRKECQSQPSSEEGIEICAF